MQTITYNVQGPWEATINNYGRMMAADENSLQTNFIVWQGQSLHSFIFEDFSMGNIDVTKYPTTMSVSGDNVVLNPTSFLLKHKKGNQDSYNGSYIDAVCYYSDPIPFTILDYNMQLRLTVTVQKGDLTDSQIFFDDGWSHCGIPQIVSRNLIVSNHTIQNLNNGVHYFQIARKLNKITKITVTSSITGDHWMSFYNEVGANLPGKSCMDTFYYYYNNGSYYKSVIYFIRAASNIDEIAFAIHNNNNYNNFTIDTLDYDDTYTDVVGLLLNINEDLNARNWNDNTILSSDPITSLRNNPSKRFTFTVPDGVERTVINIRGIDVVFYLIKNNTSGKIINEVAPYCSPTEVWGAILNDSLYLEYGYFPMTPGVYHIIATPYDSSVNIPFGIAVEIDYGSPKLYVNGKQDSIFEIRSGDTITIFCTIPAHYGTSGMLQYNGVDIQSIETNTSLSFSPSDGQIDITLIAGTRTSNMVSVLCWDGNSPEIYVESENIINGDMASLYCYNSIMGVANNVTVYANGYEAGSSNQGNGWITFWLNYDTQFDCCLRCQVPDKDGNVKTYESNHVTVTSWSSPTIDIDPTDTINGTTITIITNGQMLNVASNVIFYADGNDMGISGSIGDGNSYDITPPDDSVIDYYIVVTLTGNNGQSRDFESNHITVTTHS